MSISTTRRVLAAAAAAALATVTVGAVPASAGVSSTGELGVALFYSNDEYALFTGPAASPANVAPSRTSPFSTTSRQKTFLPDSSCS
jgi:hypothetical protein